MQREAAARGALEVFPRFGGYVSDESDDTAYSYPLPRKGNDMSDESRATAPDRSRINLNEPSEFKYWRKKFGCTEQQLLQAILTVGDSAAKVRQYFKSKSRPAERRKIGYD
jgi:hypothetical protein